MSDSDSDSTSDEDYVPEGEFATVIGYMTSNV